MQRPNEKQLSALRGYINRLKRSNCRIRDNHYEFEADLIGNRLYAIINIADTKNVFTTFALVLIGPRGGLDIRHEERRVW